MNIDIDFIDDQKDFKPNPVLVDDIKQSNVH